MTPRRNTSRLRLSPRRRLAPRQRPRLLAGALVLAAGALVLAAPGTWGQGESGDAAQGPPPAGEGSERPTEGPPTESGRPVSDDVFIPTEEIAADDEITFPVDI